MKFTLFIILGFSISSIFQCFSQNSKSYYPDSESVLGSSKQISINIQQGKELLFSESKKRMQIRKDYSSNFKKVVYNLDYKLLDSILTKSNNNLKKSIAKIKNAEKSNCQNLDIYSHFTLQAQLSFYQSGNISVVAEEYSEYVNEILNTIIPENFIDNYGFQFIYLNSFGGLAATIKFNGTIVIPLNTFCLPIADKENFLAFLIAHEVAHNLLYTSIKGRWKSEVESNRLACMLLKRAGYSISSYRDYLDYMFLYQRLFNGGYLNKFWGEYSKDILSDFDLETGKESLVSNEKFNKFRNYCVINSIVSVSSIDKNTLELNLNNSFLNFIKNPEDENWQLAIFETIRRMILLEYIKPSQRAIKLSLKPNKWPDIPESVRNDYNDSKIGIFGLVEFFSEDKKGITNNKLRSIITYDDFIKYFLNNQTNSKEFRQIQFLYEQSTKNHSSNNTLFGKNLVDNDENCNFLFLTSNSNRLRFLSSNNHSEILPVPANSTRKDFNLFINQSFDDSIYYANTQILSLINSGVKEYNKLKFSSIYAYNFLEHHKSNIYDYRSINVWVVPTKLGIYGSAIAALISGSTFWLGIEIGLIAVKQIPFTTVKDIRIDNSKKVVDVKRRTGLFNQSSHRAINRFSKTKSQ